MAKTDKNYLVLGLGISGRSVARLLAGKGHGVVIHDDDPTVVEKALASDELAGVGLVTAAPGGDVGAAVRRCDCVVLSPGVSLDHPAVALAEKEGKEVTGELEIAYAHSTSKIVGVTGTNGKSTVTSLIGCILKAAGRHSETAGNIGTPLSVIVERAEQPDTVVLEISSFQLDTIKSFKCDVALLLNVTEDHLDRYNDSIEEYARSKARILNRADEDTFFVYNDCDATCRRIAADHCGPTIPFSSDGTLDEGVFTDGGDIVRSWRGKRETVMAVKEFTPVGIHNLENALASIASVIPLEVADEVIRDALREYHPLPHRMELVRVAGGVAYIDDSKATNVDAAIKSVRSIDGPVILILGGSEKSADFTPLRDHVGSVKQAILLGESAKRIRAALEGACAMIEVGSMSEAVRESSRLAAAGDTVLLAPACASFDMFDNYGERGDVFSAEVNAL